MIKYDVYEAKDFEKRSMKVLGLISIFITVYTIVFLLISKLLKKLGVKKSVIAIGHVVLIILSFIWLKNIDNYSLATFLRPYFDYIHTIFLISPDRLMIGLSYSLLFLFIGHRTEEGMEDWVIEEEKKKRKKMLPYGEINYEDRSHMLVFGGTRTGKGVLLNHMMKNRILNHKDELLVVVSAKLASGDKYSQLAYMRKLAKETHRKLYVVSMDENVEDSCIYNPFKYLNKGEVLNLLNTLLTFDSHFYGSNFVNWVLKIWSALKAGDTEVTLKKIISLYNYSSKKRNTSSFLKYVTCLHDIEKITDEEFEEFTDEKTEKLSKNADNDEQNLTLVNEACENVFERKGKHKKICIVDAFNENALIYFDLNGASMAESIHMLGACIMAELQHCQVEFSDDKQKKTIILDEASYYINKDLIKSFFNVSASMGYQYIISTQGPSDIDFDSGTLKHQLNNNLGQLCTFRVSDPDDEEMINGLIGTVVTSENTHRAFSVDYNMTGSVKPINQSIVPHDVIKNLPPLNMVYLEKAKSFDDEAHPVRVELTVEDL